MDAGLVFRSQTWGQRVAAFGGGNALPPGMLAQPWPDPNLTAGGGDHRMLHSARQYEWTLIAGSAAPITMSDRM